jgi:hypothetical protein
MADLWILDPAKRAKALALMERAAADPRGTQETRERAAKMAANLRAIEGRRGGETTNSAPGL